jgi:hypothetical protein
MKSHRPSLWVACFIVGLLRAGISAEAGFELGVPPSAPADVSGLPRNVGKLLSDGFTVNTSSRESVRSFYNAVYTASDGAPMNSSANIASCFAGTNSVDFRDAVVRRINWFRAMAGMPAAITLTNPFNTNDQLAALMMSANSSLSHTPPPTWTCFSTAGSNAANNSNIALGVAGPDAVSGFIQDPGTNNAAAGHRRWLLYPQTQLMGAGDVPQQGSYAPANAIWVFDGHYGDPRPATRTAYVAWPPAGYVPAAVVYPRWSFGFTNADFTGAMVSMRSNGVAVATALEPVANGFGENTLVWRSMGLGPSDTGFPFDGMDTVYTVGISNVVVNSKVTNFNYTVTLFDTATPGPDYFPPIISGPSQPFVGGANAYTFNSVSNATSYQWRYSRVLPFNFFDGAEAGLGNFATNTAPDYSVIATTPVASGTHSFQLAHSQPQSQTLTLTASVFPLTNSMLQFKSLLAAATDIQVARVQVSTTGGATWSDVFAQAGAGFPGESTFSTKNISLGSFTGSPILLRFNYDISFGSYYNQTGPQFGWHFDDILITNANQLVTPVTNSIAGTNFVFNPPAAGTYNLEARGVIFTDFPLDWGPTKQVVAISNSAPTVITINRIAVTNTQAQIDFTLASGSAASFKLQYANPIPGSWNTDAAAVLNTNVPGSSYRFNTTTSGNARFYRIQSP